MADAPNIPDELEMRAKWGDFAFPYLTEDIKGEIVDDLIPAQDLQPRDIADDTLHKYGVRLVSRVLARESEQAFRNAGNNVNKLSENWRRCRYDPRSAKLAQIEEEIEKL